MTNSEYEEIVRELERALVTPDLRRKLYLLIANATVPERRRKARGAIK